MKIYLKQEDKDIRMHIQSVLKQKNTDLAKACRIAGVDYEIVELYGSDIYRSRLTYGHDA